MARPRVNRQVIYGAPVIKKKSLRQRYGRSVQAPGPSRAEGCRLDVGTSVKALSLPSVWVWGPGKVMNLPFSRVYYMPVVILGALQISLSFIHTITLRSRRLKLRGLMLYTWNPTVWKWYNWYVNLVVPGPCTFLSSILSLKDKTKNGC